MTFEQLGAEMVTTGALSAEELAAMIAMFDDPSVSLLSQTTVAAWGQRPVR